MSLEALLFPAFAVAFVLFWCGIPLVISKTGWSGLADLFGTSQPAQGRRFGWASGRVGAASYGSSPKAHIQPDGLRLSVVAPFRVGHPPLLIPWEAITDIEPIKQFGSRSYVLHVGDLSVPVQLPARVVEAAGQLATGTEASERAL